MGRRASRRTIGLATVVGVVLAAACSSAADPAPTIGESTTTVAATATAEPDAGPPPLPDLGDGPVLMFGAIPPKPDTVDYAIPTGAADYFDLFEPDAPWAEAMERVDVFRLHAFQLRHYLSDEQLTTILDWLDEHQIPLLFETEPLQPPDPEECDHTESFEGPYDLEMAQRIKDLGGTIAVVAIEQPFTYAYKNEGERVCHYTLERIVDEVSDYMAEMREMFHGVPVGSIEGIWINPATTPDDMALWLDTWEEITGEPFAFLHIDPDWDRPDWAEVMQGIEKVADERGVPFGILYNGGTESTSQAWLQTAAEHIAEYETNTGGTPDHISLQTWVDQPDHVLPEGDPGAFTSLINRYSGDRAQFESIALAAASTDSPAQLQGRLIDSNGAGLLGQEVQVTVSPQAGGLTEASTSGAVPAGASVALIGVRVNAENAVPGDADIRVHGFHYSEDGGVTNLVPNGDFSRGDASWGFYGDPTGDGRIDAGDQTMVLRAEPDQVIYVDGEQFPVTPGADFDFSATFDFGPDSAQTGVLSVIFLEADRRTNIRVEPVARELPAVTTETDGAFVVDLPELTGLVAVDIVSVGDLTTWPALLSTTIDTTAGT